MDILQMTDELKEELEHLNRKGVLPPVFTGRRTALSPCQQWTSIARQTVCPGRHQFPIFLFVSFFFFFLFVCFVCLFIYFLLSIRNLSSCHSAFHELGLVFERTHRSYFLFLRSCHSWPFCWLVTSLFKRTLLRRLNCSCA